MTSAKILSYDSRIDSITSPHHSSDERPVSSNPNSAARRAGNRATVDTTDMTSTAETQDFALGHQEMHRVPDYESPVIPRQRKNNPVVPRSLKIGFKDIWQ